MRDPLPRDERRFIVLKRVFHDDVDLSEDDRAAFDDAVNRGPGLGLLRPDVVPFDKRRFKFRNRGPQLFEKIGRQCEAGERLGERGGVARERVRVREQFAIGFGRADDEFLFEVRDGQGDDLRRTTNGLHLLRQPFAGIRFEGLLTALAPGLGRFGG